MGNKGSENMSYFLKKFIIRSENIIIFYLFFWERSENMSQA